MKTAEIIKMLCFKNGVSVSELEKHLGFSNGSLTKDSILRSDRLQILASYFNVSMEYLMTGITDPPANSLINIPTHDINFMKWVKKLSELPEEYRKEIYKQIDYQTYCYENELKEKEGTSNA